MTLIQHVADILGAGLLGAFLVAAFGLTAADRRGYARAVEEHRIVEGAKLARAVEDPPLDGPQILTGAEPASGQVRVGVTGRSLAPRTSGNAAPTTGEEAPPQAGAPAGSLLQLLDDEPDREKYPHWPWTVLPLEPGLGEHDEQEPEHEAVVEPVRTVLLPEAPRGPRHAKPDLDPLTDSRVDAVWPELVALLQTRGLGALALPCTHCEVDHVGCPGCACGCKLSEVSP